MCLLGRMAELKSKLGAYRHSTLHKFSRYRALIMTSLRRSHVMGPFEINAMPILHYFKRMGDILI